MRAKDNESFVLFSREALMPQGPRDRLAALCSPGSVLRGSMPFTVSDDPSSTLLVGQFSSSNHETHHTTHFKNTFNLQCESTSAPRDAPVPRLTNWTEWCADAAAAQKVGSKQNRAGAARFPGTSRCGASAWPSGPTPLPQPRPLALGRVKASSEDFYLRVNYSIVRAVHFMRKSDATEALAPACAGLT